MRRYLLLFLIGITILVGLVFCATVYTPRIEQKNLALHPLVLYSSNGSDISLEVEWATTEQERSYGLMNREIVKNGMLFIFEKSEPLTFWMKHTFMPLDIIFFDDAGSYVSSTMMLPCTIDPCTLYPSEKPARYALEMPAGFLQKTPIDKDWKMVH